MTITRRTPTDSGNTTYTVSAKTLTLPTNSAAGDLVVIAVCEKPNTSGDASINEGFTLVRSATGGTGTQTTDQGATKLNLFAKILTGSEGTITITPGSSVSSWCHINFCYASSKGGWANSIEADAPWTATGSDTTQANPVTATVTPTTKPTAGDHIEAVGAVPTDAGTGIPDTATITAAGLSGGSVTAGGGWAQSSTGNDSGIIASYWTGFTGTSTSTIVPSITNPGATYNYGCVGTFSIREASAVSVGQVTDSQTSQAHVRLKSRQVRPPGLPSWM